MSTVPSLAAIPMVSPEVARRLSQSAPHAAGAVRDRARESVVVVLIGRMAASIIHRI
ncbi:MAG: hypothetical protein ACOH17_01965 [Cellulomonas sp.]